MKAFSDFLAILLFVGTYLVTKNIIWATSVAIVIGIIQAAYLWFKFKKLSSIQWFSLLSVIIFGGATIIFKDFFYIVLKTTLICWLTAAVILTFQLRGKNGIKMVIGSELTLPEHIWTHLSYAWILFFFIIGIINLAVAYPFTPEREAFWFQFKLYGYLPLILIFSIAQGIYISRNLSSQEKS